MGLFGNSDTSNFPWEKLDSLDLWKKIWTSQDDRIYAIFKHSTRCVISSMALRNLEREFQPGEGETWFLLDLLNHRDISNQIAEDTGIIHQSPQAIIWKNGKIIYHATHQHIEAEKITESLKA
jgi:bacillithiol system protein YtxJ